MSAVLVAVFKEYTVADAVRTRLVKDGFPTDRVELTSRRDPGRAALEPAASRRTKVEQYFRTLLCGEREQQFVKALVERIEGGAAAVAVHPRGTIETTRAAEILQQAGAVEVVAHDLEDQSFEQAASPEEGYWVRHLMPESTGGTD